MKDKKKRGGKIEKGVMIAMSFALLLIMISYMPSSNLYRELNEFREQLKLIRTEIEHLENIEAEEEMIRAEWEVWIEEKDRLESILPGENEFPFILVALEETISGYPLKLVSMRAGEKTFHQSHSKVKVEIAIAGHPANLELFLGQIKSFPHFLAFDSIKWSRSGEEEIMIDLVLELFFIDQIDTPITKRSKEPVIEENLL